MTSARPLMPTPPMPTKCTCWYRLKTRVPVIASGLGPLRDVEEDTHAGHRDQERGPAGRHERERQPLRGQEPDDHGEVDRGLGGEERRDPERQQGPERVADPEADPDAAPEQEPEEGHRE